MSSYTMDRFESDLLDMADGWAPDEFNWSIWEHDNARIGDKFLMVNVGPGINGIVMSGELHQNHTREKIGPAKVECPLLTSEELAKEIPDFVWDEGHSGQLLTEEQADKLLELWDKYLNENGVIFAPRAARNDD